MLNGARFGLQRHALINLATFHGVCRVSRISHHADHLTSHLFHAPSRDALIVGVGELCVKALPSVGLTVGHEVTWRGGAIPRNHGAKFEPIAPPPINIRLVAEGADHQNAGALLRIGLVASEDRYLREESGCNGVLAEQTLISLVVRVRRHADACGNQLRSRR